MKTVLSPARESHFQGFEVVKNVFFDGALWDQILGALFDVFVAILVSTWVPGGSILAPLGVSFGTLVSRCVFDAKMVHFGDLSQTRETALVRPNGLARERYYTIWVPMCQYSYVAMLLCSCVAVLLCLRSYVAVSMCLCLCLCVYVSMCLCVYGSMGLWVYGFVGLYCTVAMQLCCCVAV